MTARALIDAHHHLWDLNRLEYPWLQGKGEPGFFLGDYRSLRRNYLPEDFRRDSASVRVLASVHCEAEHVRGDPLAETLWLAEQQAGTGLPSVLVAWAPLLDPDADRVLEAQAHSPLVRGIRYKPLTAGGPREIESIRGQPGSLQDPAWHRALMRLQHLGLSWDLRVPWWHLEDAAALLDAHPDLTVVLNHTGLPWDRSPKGLALWRRGMAALARLPQVAVKVSEFGLPEAGWDEAQNRRLVRETLELFGHERCLFGSNFPVASLRIGYAELVAHFENFLAEDTVEQREAFFWRTAQRIYRIPLTTPIP